MLIRIVRMHFRTKEVPTFLALFQESRAKVRTQAGCSHLELCQDVAIPEVYYTISHWDAESSLNAYRDSELFEGIWARTKVLFADKPRAYSLVPEGAQ